MKPLRPYSRPDALTRLDHRSKEARLMRETRKQLTTHVGGKPSATERALIERAVMLTLHLHLMDRKIIEAGGAMTEHDSRTYLAWSNSLTRTMRELGLKGVPGRLPTLEEHKAARSRAA